MKHHASLQALRFIALYVLGAGLAGLIAYLIAA
ncbi:hypothetical protein ACWT_5832 [Actinoplanes sp. SE50]|nr:hypothetical protein ACPL_5963 [Actinoplanes sp. SE50/110]ATO85247.1 hypothetical protein ACWT_5832 [Actinoplanes sp. SE50]SLM02657.1 hypothetical protein ACSP50_5939 [Actinoplanes sp. SE50/110]